MIGGGFAPPYNYFFDQVEVFYGAGGDTQQVYFVAAAVAYVGGDHHFGLGVQDAVAEGAGAEAGVDYAVNRADAGAGEHGDGALGG